MAKKKAPGAPKTPTARERLQPSKLRQTQLELLGDDVDISDLYLALNHKDINIEEAVLDVTVERTIQGSSTVTVEVLDRDRVLLRSGRLSSKNDIEIDGLFFRLASVRKQGDNLELTFEDREIALLKSYSKPIKQSPKTARGQMTRAEFVLRLIKEVKEEAIPYVIPELHVVQPIDGGGKQPPTQFQQSNRGYGIAKGSSCTVKGVPMGEEQRKNANMILNALAVQYQRPIMVMAIMCATQESSIINRLPYPLDRSSAMVSAFDQRENPVGVFQQRAYIDGRRSSWPASRDVTKDTLGFASVCEKHWKDTPNAYYANIIEATQISGENPMATYGKWRTEAERTVDAYGIVENESNNTREDATIGSTSNYEFYRGVIPQGRLNKQKLGSKWGPETSWKAIQRMAQDVNFRAFFVSGTFYWISEDMLIASQPIATINEDTDGIISIDGDYDEYSKVATVSIDCIMGRWAAPPGSVVQLVDMGPWNGRWLVNDVSKSLFSPQGSITLKKASPKLPEPSTGNIFKSTDSAWTWSPKNKNANTSDGASNKIPSGDRIVLAQKLLTYHDVGRWTDDNGKGLAQIQKTAAGMMVSSQDPELGQVYLNDGPLRAVVWLISQGYKIGTYAWCSDHFDDDQHGPGHAAGYAVDISSINGVSINQYNDQCYKNVLAVATLLHDAKAPILPRQLITGGYGNVRNSTLSALSIPSADMFYGSGVMQQHTNHIHVGY